MAVTLADIVARRLMTGLDGDLGLGSLDGIAEVAARALGWVPDRVEEEKQRYRHYIAKFEQDREVSL
jgi:glycerol-3-phosphate dehydrogenase